MHTSVCKYTDTVVSHTYVCEYTDTVVSHTYVCKYTDHNSWESWYLVASISRLLKIIGLFCRVSSLF